MGDIPMCLLMDGEFPLEGLPEKYNVLTLRKKDVRSPLLRKRSYGWGTTKMIAYWEAPFEYFLLIDADTIVWGNMQEKAMFDKYDVILHAHPSWSPESISQWFFKIEKMNQYFPGFDCLKHPYANAGVIFGKRGIFNIKQYEEILDFADEHPEVFFPGDQGFHNYMLYNAHEEGRIRVGVDKIQYIVPDFPIEEAREKFVIEDRRPKVQGEPVLIHWSGSKPFVVPETPMYTEAMTYFREKFLSDSTDKSPREIRSTILEEDRKRKKEATRGRTRSLIKKKLRSIIGSL
jgi:lipopolysaccharide biosynthesis glycosyltransferase